MDKQTEHQNKSLFESIVNFFITLKPYIKKAWECRKQLLIFNGSVLIISLLILIFLIKPYFNSKIIILPDFGNKNSDMISQFSGIASLAGININDEPPTLLYKNLIMSETVISDVIYRQYQTEEYDHPVNLIQYFKIKPMESLPESLQSRGMFLSMFGTLTKTQMSADFDRTTNILVVTAEMPESRLSADVANALVISLDKYVRTQRRSYAIEQRKYLDVRINQVKDTLKHYEEQLQIFRETNRQILQSPKLQLAQARLMRNVEIQQIVYGELIKQLELIKLQEIKDTPMVNVREYAKEPIIKAGPKRGTILIVILFISFLISSGWYLNRDKIINAWKQIRH
jgi:hypothetical protein